MALGKRKREQQEAWVATTDLPKSPGHPFYKKLNGLLAEAGKRLQRLLSELTECGFAHVCETCGTRRCLLRELANVGKRYLLQVAARELSLIIASCSAWVPPAGYKGHTRAVACQPCLASAPRRVPRRRRVKQTPPTTDPDPTFALAA